MRHFHEVSHLHELTVRERPGKECLRCWREGPGFDRNLFSPEAISSSPYHLDVPPRPQHPELPMIHGLPEGAMV